MGNWLSNIASSVGGFLSDNSSWLKPVAQVGMDLLGASRQRDATQQYLNQLKQAEQQNYNDQKSQYDAYTAYLAANSGGGGGGGGGASAQNEANRLSSLKKALDYEKKNFKTTQGFLMPYYEAGKNVLPARTQTYQAGLTGLQNLFGFMNTPEMLAKLNASRPSFQVNIPTPNVLNGAYGTKR